jgi:hypothetical protein
MLRMPFSLVVRSTYLHASLWKESVCYYNRYSNHPQVMMVQYEHLVADPEATLRSICHFLDEEYMPSLLSHVSQTSSEHFGSEHRKLWKGSYMARWWDSHLDRVHRPIDNERVGVWNEELSSLQQWIVEYVTFREASQVGYEVHRPTIGVLRALAIGWSAVFGFVLDPVRRLYRAIPLVILWLRWRWPFGGHGTFSVSESK